MANFSDLLRVLEIKIEELQKERFLFHEELRKKENAIEEMKLGEISLRQKLVEMQDLLLRRDEEIAFGQMMLEEAISKMDQYSQKSLVPAEQLKSNDDSALSSIGFEFPEKGI
jgi:hypothetical protein